MPDSFFATSKSRKRKRSTTGDDGAAHRNVKSKKFSRGGSSLSNGRTRDSGKRQSGPSSTAKVNGSREKKSKGKTDEELDSDQTNDEDGGGIDDLDLRPASDDDVGHDDDGEDKDETPAEKRLRLAKLYLQSVKEDLGGSFSPTTHHPCTHPCFLASRR